MKPKLTLLCGLPGSGKSTLAKEMQSQKNTETFSSDKLLIRTYGTDFPPEKFDEYQKTLRESIKKKTTELLRAGVSVVLDFGFWTKAERTEYIELARQEQADSEIIFFDVSQTTLLKRIETRNTHLKHDELLVTPEMLTRFSKTFEPPTEDETTIYRIEE